MKSRTISLRRRRLMIAGLAGSAAPALAAPFDIGGGVLEAINEFRDGQYLVISGRVVARDGRAVSGAAVEMWRAGEVARTTTDGDGRFFVQIAGERSGRPERIGYRVSGGALTMAKDELYFERGRARAERHTAQLQRDESGTWRAACGISLA